MLLSELQVRLAQLAQFALPARLRSHTRSRGQGLVEYALIIALVAIVVVATVLLLGNTIKDVFQNIADSL